MICTFFGHKDCPFSIKESVKTEIRNLIEHYKVNEFYIGNQGNFDSLCVSALKELQTEYPFIKYSVVLAYFPKENIENSIFPEGLETVPPRFQIDKRNRWMIKNSDYVITYITRNAGGAAKYSAIAEKSGKTIINIK